MKQHYSKSNFKTKIPSKDKSMYVKETGLKSLHKLSEH